MRRIFLYIYTVILAMLTLASCSDDLTDPKTNPDVPAGNIKLSISATPLGGTDVSSRATTEEGGAGENIKSWFVVIADSTTREIKQILTSEATYDNTSANSDEITDDTRYLHLDDGKYMFYAFANMSEASVLGEGVGVGSILPADFNTKTYDFSGNKPFRVVTENEQTASELFPKGIPMSCKKAVTVDKNTSTVTLNLIRMVAKIQISVRNPTEQTIYIDSISIRHITRDNIGNIRLFPDTIENKTTGARKVNLVSYTDQTRQQVFTYITPTSENTSTGGSPENYTFYVNESHVPDNNPFEIAIARHTDESDASTINYQEVSGWFSIGRNEFHKLSANLDRYRIDVTVYPYTAIGIMPVVSNDAQMLSLTLNQYGHYDIVPRVVDTQRANSYYTLYSPSAMDVGITSKYTNDRRQLYGTGSNQTYVTPDLRIDTVIVAVDQDQYEGWEDSNGNKHYPTIGWNSTAMVPRIECITGNYDGLAEVTITVKATILQEEYLTNTSATVPQQITITRRMRINNRYIDISKLAKPRL